MAVAKKSNSSKKPPIGNRLTYYIKAPYRALISARDLYVSSLGGCAGRVQQGRAIPSRVPRSQSHAFFRRRQEDDVAELLRAAPQGRLGPLGIRLTDTAAVPRSQSAGAGAASLPMMTIERIEEEGASDLEGSSRGGSSPYPRRSRSCAVVPSGRVLDGMAGVAAA